MSSPNITKLDMHIQSFLERREYEQFDIAHMEEEKSDAIEFVKISHIAYDRARESNDTNLVDFEQLLSAIASKSGKIIYMVDSNKDGIALYLGTSGGGTF